MFDGLDDAYPLTSLQQGMLYETLKNPDSDVYVAYITIDILPGLNPERLQSAWLRAKKKHETLRTRFVWEGLDEPLQLVESDTHLNWTECGNPPVEADIQSNSGDAIVDYWLQCERDMPLSLSDSPPMRLRLIALPDGKQVLIWTVHHLLADDWSTPLVLKTVAEFYDATATVTEGSTVNTKQLAFGRYVDWLSKSSNEASLQWWTNALATARPTPLLLGGEGRDALDISAIQHQHQRLYKVLELTESQAITRKAVSLGCTLSTVMHAAWAVVVARYAGERSALFGTSVSGRSADLPAIEEAVGLFLHTLPTHVSIREEESADNYLLRIQRQLFEQIEHEHIDLPALGKLIPREPGSEPFETVLVVEAHGPDLSIEIPSESASFTNIRYVTDSNFPLTVLVFPGDQIQIQLIGPNSRFSLNELRQISDEFIAVIANLCAADVSTVGKLIDCQDQRMEGQYVYRSLCVTPKHKTADEWIVKTAERCRSDIAVIDDGVEFTYQQLLNLAQSIAHQVTNRSVDSAFVGIHIDRGFNQISSILGVLMSGKAYVPLDCAWPDERIAGIVQDAGIGLVLSDNRNGARNALREVDVIAVDVDIDLDNPDSGGSLGYVEACVGSHHGTEDAAYMIYTSGSTGRPKGVAISHENLIYSTAARIDFYKENPRRYLLLSSFSFDSSIAGIFWTLCSGGTLVLPGPIQALDVYQLEEQISQCRVTHTLCLPSLYSLLLRFADTEKLSSLSCVIVAGEVCSSSLPKQHHQLLPDTDLFNEYGPTEATVWSTVAKLSGGDQAFSLGVPIGYSIPGSRARAVDQHGRIVPRGVTGELQISGPGVSNGYHGDSELSSQRFKLSSVPQAVPAAMEFAYQSGDYGMQGADGQLYFMGRTDRQLKVRGYRIEAGEIESRILANPAVKEAFCCLQSIGVSSETSDSKRLVCFYTLVDSFESGEPCVLLPPTMLANQREAVERDAQERINQELPAHFSVSAFAAVNVMARLSNDKMDESGFPHIAQAFESGAAADSLRSVSPNSNPMFAGLCQVLSQLLGLQEVKPSDNFFSLGGDSLAAIRFVAASRERGLMLTIPMISGSSTIAELADVLSKRKSVQGTVRGSSQSTVDDSTLSGQKISLQDSAQSLMAGSLPGDIADLENFGLTPLSPAQRWFMSLNQTCPTHWNMAFVINLSAAAPYQRICDAIHDTLRANPVLASQFDSTVGNASVKIADVPDFTQSIHPTPDNSILIEEHLDSLQQDFDLRTGQLIRFSLDPNSDGACDKIGVVVHHLVSDALSNWLFANEITRRLFNDTMPIFGGSVSYRDWSTQISRKWPQREDTAIEGARSAQRVVPTSLCIEENVVEHRLSIEATLWSSMRDYAENQKIELHELCLYVILQSWQQQGSIRVDVETHGRDAAAVSGDTSATIGWFTAFFKLVVEAYKLDNVARFSRTFKQKKSAGCQDFLENPESFFDYTGMSDDGGSTPALLYNFLAMDIDQSKVTDDSTGFTLTSLVDGRFRDKHSFRSHALEVIVLDEIGGVSVLWRTDESMLTTLGIERWIAAVQSNLHRLSQLELSQKEQTLSEQFPDSGLSDSELDQFLSGLD